VSAVLSDQAMADVLAAVDASTAANTKAAYRSDWARFTVWAAEGRFTALPADPLVVAHYVTEAAAEQIGAGALAVHPGHPDPVGVLDQPVPHRGRARRTGPGRGGAPGAVRDLADPLDATASAGTAAPGRHPHADHLDRRNG
jgi:hypothetical protein